MADYHRMGSNNSNILCFLLFQPSLVATFLTENHVRLYCTCLSWHCLGFQEVVNPFLQQNGRQILWSKGRISFEDCGINGAGILNIRLDVRVRRLVCVWPWDCWLFKWGNSGHILMNKIKKWVFRFKNVWINEQVIFLTEGGMPMEWLIGQLFSLL